MPAEDVQLVLRCREVSDVADKARAALGEGMAALAGDNRVYTFKSRVKTPGAVLSKVKRKRAEQAKNGGTASGYGPDHVTDVWGCRYVTLYQSQIPPAVKALLDHFDAINAAFGHGVELREFVIYTNRPTQDPLSIVNETVAVLGTCAISAAVAGHDRIRAPENRKSAYSSVHLIFAIPMTMEHPGRETVLERATFEVQVRDIFEEGWGEIQHDLIYSGKDRLQERPAAETDLDPLWQPHLNALKTFVDGCSQHASIIKRAYDFVQLKSMPSLQNESATDQLTDRDAILAALDRQAHGVAVEAIKAGYDLVIGAQNADGPADLRGEFAAAALKFEQALDALGPSAATPVSHRSGFAVGYFLRMELASCLFQQKGRAEMERAEALYVALRGEWATNPTVSMRLSIAKAALHPDEPSALEEARALIEDAVAQVPHDPLTGPGHWLSVACQVQLGYPAWRLSRTPDRPAGEVAGDLAAAVRHTQAAFDAWDGMAEPGRSSETHVLQAHKALSNLLYYAAELINASEDPARQGYVEQVKGALGKIDDLKVPRYREYYKTRDNKMHALLAIGRKAEARACARENVQDLKSRAERAAGHPLWATQLDPYLSSGELLNYRMAASVLADPDAQADP